MSQVELERNINMTGHWISYLVREVFGEGPHPLAGVRDEDLFYGLQVHPQPTHILVLLKTGDLISGSLKK